MEISPHQALDLEIKLNKTLNGKKWLMLGNILYIWRINPDYYEINHDRIFNITEEQFDWIKLNIIKDCDEYRCYYLNII